jgi:hypothetical protein
MTTPVRRRRRSRRYANWTGPTFIASLPGRQPPRRLSRRATSTTSRQNVKLEPVMTEGDILRIQDVVRDVLVADPVASPDLHALSDLGVQLSVDDVGTNWSSFEPFRRNSISTVKIDGSFTSGLEAQQGINRLVVETVTHMAHSLGMSAIIEKVESAEQAEIAKVFHVDAAQGYFFSEPLPQGQARILASLPEVPVFSRTDVRTLVLQDGTTVPLSEALAAAETGPIGVAVPVPEAADA